jgi:hypothetical protein
MLRNGLSTVSASRSDWLAHHKVKEKSQQVRKQGGDQYPEKRPHRAPPSVRKHEAETQKPDSDRDAEN